MRAGFLLILFFCSASVGWAQSTVAIKDLRNYWQVSVGDELNEYQGQPVNALHLPIKDQFRGGIILIQAPDEFTLFVNGQIQTRSRLEFKLNVDSLLSVWPGEPALAIFQKGNIKTIRTDLIYRSYSENENIQRKSTHFEDFVILGVLILFGFFVILFRTNTRLTVDYLNIAKVFSIQEREEVTVTGRIGSSVNILFFAFISLFGGLVLLIIFNGGPPSLQPTANILIESTVQALGRWFLFSFLIFIFLIAKLLLIWSMSSLFGFKGVVRFQFFNFIRSLYVVAALMGVFLIGYFIWGKERPDFFYFLLASACGFMILSTFFLYFKLMTRTSSTVFHLFSYLCGSEIIPLMILIKVLLN